MSNLLTTLVRRWRYGEPVAVVSGLPRSGTSMLMKMLEAGGVPIMTDDVRAADEDNPKGYFELERVKDLENETDRSWIRGARGKALKVISHLLKELPSDNFYRVILSARKLEEVLASQNIMLERSGKPNPVSDEKAMDLYRSHLINVKVLARTRPNFELLEVGYHDTLSDPTRCADRMNAFLGGGLDLGKMAEVVDGQLYRNRR